MYRPTLFQEDNLEKLVAFMQANSFATLVSIVDGVPFATHIPFVVSVDGDVVKLSGHLAKQNPQWQAFSQAESLAIFTGAHAYVSPSLYEKRENVPTWNYIAVHAYGVPHILTLKDSPQLMNEMIDDMIDTYEASYKPHWHDLSHSFREGMMNGIVGFEMIVSKLEGKYKLSQNRNETDQQAVAHALLHSSDPAAQAVGQAMAQNLNLNS
ncbi:FMN-binding negative transcriptional regulator [Leptolyngbya sp. AN02str]|uniref:FMN-binding negative transcriptional regulator n=1 Tax=Leptolyngbya sp. AN02str TaxID=3423363 RepID=UPI003D31044F